MRRVVERDLCHSRIEVGEGSDAKDGLAEIAGRNFFLR